MPASVNTSALSPSEWGTLGTFALLLIGLSILDMRLATIAGLGVIGVIVVQHSNAFLGGSQP